MALSWSFRRQALYYVVAAVIGVVVVAAAWQIFFTKMPTCLDGVQNGTELGVDCGGTCSLLCAQTARPPRVVWSRAFAVAPSTYTAAAYIENENTLAGAKAVRYSFKLFDASNILIVERAGTVDLPPVHTIPIIESGIDTGTRAVARSIFSFSLSPTWHTAPQPPALRLTQQDLSADASRLSATLINDSSQTVTRVTVAVVLFDASGTARAASKTTLASLARKSSQQIIFTWPSGVPNIVRAEMHILPSL